MNMGCFLTGRVIWPASSTMQTSNLRFPNMACVIPRQVTPTTRALSTIASISRTFATVIPGIHYWGKKIKIWSSGYLLCCKDIWSNKLENKYKNTHKKKGAPSQHVLGTLGERKREPGPLITWPQSSGWIASVLPTRTKSTFCKTEEESASHQQLSNTRAVQPWEKTTPNNSRKSVSLWLSSSSLILTLCSAHLHSFYVLIMGFACSKQTCIFSLSRILSTAEFV